MKRILLFFAVAVLVLSGFSCAGGGAGGGDTSTDLWSDAGTTDSSISLSNEDLNLSASVSSILSGFAQDIGSSDDRVYFRSSDVEFWSISGIDDLDTICSQKYKVGNSAPGEGSLEYDLGDLQESVVFRPYSRVATQLGAGLNEDWDTNVASYKSDGNTNINLARLDIGDGTISFIINGERTGVSHSDGSGSSWIYTPEEIEALWNDGDNGGQYTYEEYQYYLELAENYSGIDANSIFFVDEQFLSEPFLAEREIQYDIVDGTLTASDFSIATDEFNFIKRLFSNSNEAQDEVTESTIDVDGALLVPTTPVDISGFDPSSEALKIVISWKMASAVRGSSDGYRMDDRIGGTCLDFDVELVIE